MSSRLSFFDNVKMLLITLVVIGHLIDVSVVSNHLMAKAAFTFIYSFHMPLFIFLSGLFVKRERLTPERVAHDVTMFVVLGYAAKVVLWIVPVLYGKEFSFSLLSDPGIPWYMFVMVHYYLLAYALRNVNPSVILALSVLVGLFVGYDESIGDFLYLSRTIVYLPFFWLGYVLDPVEVENTTKTRAFQVLGICALVAFACVCLRHTEGAYRYRELFTGRNSFANTPIEGCSWVNRLIAYVISTAMCIGVLAIVPHKRIAAITDMGSRTLQVYFIHDAVLSLLIRWGVVDAVVGLPGSCWLLLFPLGAVVAIALSHKVFSYPFEMLSKAVWENESSITLPAV